MNVLNFKIILCLFLGINIFSNTHASDLKIAKSAPFEIKLGDTSSSIFSKLRIDTSTSIYKNRRIVEDTIPPCDIIFYKSGKLEYCKIIETTPETVTYKMCDYQNGPNIVAYKSSIQKIRYANGREEVVVAEKADKSQINAYVKPRKDPLAKLAFYFGLGAVAIALVLGVVFLPLVLAGLVLGTISIIKIARRRHKLRGMGLAIVGLILCVLLLLLII